MIFKKPKTTHNFELFHEIWESFLHRWMEEEGELEKDTRDESYWSIHWEINIIDDPILFWYLMIIIEEYKWFPPDYEINLATFTKPENYSSLIEDMDSELHSDTEAGEREIQQMCNYSMALFRLIWLSGVFYAFDIRNISLITYADEIGKRILKTAFLNFKDKTISDANLEELYLSLGELWWLDEKKRERKMLGYMGKNIDEERPFIWDEEFYDIFPLPDGWKRFDDMWFKVLSLWQYLKIQFEFDGENMKKLSALIEKMVFQITEEQTSLTHKFIKIAKKCEKIENTVYIAFEHLFTPEFPLLQYIYQLEKNDGCSIVSWATEDDWIVTIYDETIADALGMSREKKTDNIIVKSVIYDYKKEALKINEKSISFGDTNDAFIKSFFDLEDDGIVGIDELTESLDSMVENMTKDKRAKAEKSLVYDRIKPLNSKINKESGLEKFFYIENRKVRATYPEIIENSSKTRRKK